MRNMLFLFISSRSQSLDYAVVSPYTRRWMMSKLVEACATHLGSRFIDGAVDGAAVCSLLHAMGINLRFLGLGMTVDAVLHVHE